MDGRCAQCGTWLMPGKPTCANCHARVPGMEGVEDDPFDPLDPLGGELPTLDDDLVDAAPAPEPVSRPEPAPRPAPPRLTQARLRQEAGYGLPPDSLLSAAPYAATVFLKRRELRARIQDLKAKERVLGRALDRQRRALAEALVAEPQDADLDGLRDLLGRARDVLAGVAQAEADEAARRRSEELAHAEARASAEQAAREVEPMRDQETRAVRALEAAKGELTRTQAALRRAEIELRNAGSAGLGEQEIAALEATRASRAAEVELLAGRVEERSAALGQARRELATRLGRQAAAEEAARKLTSATTTARTASTTQLDPALVALTDAALEAAFGGSLAGPVSLCADAKAALAAATAERELLSEAETSFDAATYNRGLGILAAGVLLIVGTLLFAIFH